MKSMLIGLAAAALLASAAQAAGTVHDAKSAFEALKGLAGDWTGTLLDEGKSKPASVRYEVTSGGSAVKETMNPGAKDEMVTMYHRDGDGLVLTHFCAIGNQPRSGAKGLFTSAWFPRVTRISGCPRWTILRIGLYRDAGSLIGASAEKRTVIRSANCPSPGLGQNTRRNAPTVPYRGGTARSTSASDAPRGHQNSSASELITQSAPYSVAARRAMRVRRACAFSEVTGNTLRG